MSGGTSSGKQPNKDLRPGAADGPVADGPAPGDPDGDLPAPAPAPEVDGPPDLDVVEGELEADGPDPDAEPATDRDDGSSEDTDALSVALAERDEYLDRLQRLQAEFENYRKRMTREHTELVERAAERLAGELLPVLDACLAATSQGADDVAPVQAQLVDILTKQGLEELATEGDPFDPDRHEAVMHEPADDGDDGSTVAEVLRAGYGWKGRVLRPAMVKVRG